MLEHYYISYNVYSGTYGKSAFTLDPGFFGSYASQLQAGFYVIPQRLTGALKPLSFRCISHFQLFRTKSHTPDRNPGRPQFLARCRNQSQILISYVLRLVQAIFPNTSPVDSQKAGVFQPLQDLKNLRLITWQPAYKCLIAEVYNANTYSKFTRILFALKFEWHSQIECYSQFTRPAVSIQPASHYGRVAFLLMAGGVGLA